MIAQGSTTLSDNSTLSVTQGATFTNTGSFITQALANGNGIYSDNSPEGGTFVNNGTFAKTGSGHTSIGYGLTFVDNKLLSLNAGNP